MSNRLPNRVHAGCALVHAGCAVAISAVLLGVGLHAQPPRGRGQTAAPPCIDPVAVQVALDRQGFSPGEIDGQLGPNVRRALAAFQQAKGLQSATELDCELMKSLQPPKGRRRSPRTKSPMRIWRALSSRTSRATLHVRRRWRDCHIDR